MSSYWSGRLPFASEPGSCLNPRLELTGGAVSCDHAPGEEVYNYPDASSEVCLSRWMQGCWSDLFMILLVLVGPICHALRASIYVDCSDDACS